MSETPEGFRDRIGRVATEAEFGPGSWDREPAMAHEIASEVAKAVYAQALREIHNTIGDTFHEETVAGIDICAFIWSYAAERGLDLGESA